MGNNSEATNMRTMKVILCFVALFATACAVENQMKVEVEAKPFVPYMMATSPSLSPYYSMLYNPFSFVGYTNPQVEMFPHQLSVMKAISGKGTKPLASNLYPGVGAQAHVGGLYGNAYLGGSPFGGVGAGANVGFNPLGYQ